MNIVKEIVITLDNDEAEILKMIINEFDFDNPSIIQRYEEKSLDSINALCSVL